jgi:hypothetical protein
VLVDQHLLRESGEIGKLCHGAAAGQQSGLFVVATTCIRLHAERQAAGQAMLAMTAVGGQTRDHMVTGLDRAHLGSDLFDHTGGLMSQHNRHGMRICSVDEMQVGMTHPDRGRAHQNFARARLRDRDVLDDKRGFGRMEDGSFHPIFLLGCYCLYVGDGDAMVQGSTILNR